MLARLYLADFRYAIQRSRCRSARVFQDRFSEVLPQCPVPYTQSEQNPDMSILALGMEPHQTSVSPTASFACNVFNYRNVISSFISGGGKDPGKKHTD